MNVVSAAFVPMTPLLFRHLSGAADPVAELRDAAVAAIRSVCEGVEQVFVLCPLGGREAPGDWHDPSRVEPVHGGPRPLSLQVAEHLLELSGVEATAGAVIEDPADFPISSSVDLTSPEGLARRTALVVLGEGAAARSQGAPGHIDERSFAFDDAVAAALDSGDGAALTAYDETVAAELMVTGRRTWPVAVDLLPAARTAELTHRSDPFGLTYFVATWHA